MVDSSTLLVPMTVKALVVNDQVRKGENFQRWSMNYSNINDYNSPEPQPFSGNANDFSSNPANNGVYLLWRLPEALRHGSQTPNNQQGTGKDNTVSVGIVDFPLVPNRWLVVRYSGALAARKVTAWVVESDFLDPNEGTSPFISPFAATPTPTSIGRRIEITNQAWNEPGGTMFLSAIGAGDVTFASYQPYGENVLSIHDDLAGVADADTLSYMVMGWYSDPTKDIVKNDGSQQGLDDVLQALNWAIANKEQGTATTSLCHGMVYGVQWDKTGGIPPSNKPSESSDVTLAVGNTSIDALTALIRRQAQGDTTIQPDLLEAFQYDLLSVLSEQDSAAVLDMNIRQAWYGKQPGGFAWDIVDAELQNPAERGKIPPLPPAELQKEAQWLAQLNQNQTAYDEQLRLLNDMQWQLYAMWWKNGKAGTLPQFPIGTTQAQFDAALDPTSATSLVSKVRNQIALVQSLQATIPIGQTQEELAASIQAYAAAHQLPAQRELKRLARPDFREANDPVVLLAGTGDTSAKNPTGTLQCRFPDQLVTGFSVTTQSGGLENTPAYSGAGVHFSATAQSFSHAITLSLLDGSIPMPNLANIPALAKNIIEEFFLLDPANATMVAAKALNTTNPQIIQDVYNAMAAHDTNIGVLPAFSLKAWQQPWTPVFLEWQVSWFAIDYTADGKPTWGFDGSTYTWDGNGASQTPRVLSGRIFLTPQSRVNFKVRLREYLDKYPDANLQAVEDFIQKTDEWDFLSQALNGFEAQLTLRDPLGNIAPNGTTVLYQPSTTIADVIGENFRYVPLPGPYKKPPFAPLPPSGFQALRSGQFLFEKLSVVDEFGRAIEVVNLSTSDQFAPVVAEGMQPGKTVVPNEPYRFVQLTPSVLQPNRLNFDYVSSTNDDNVIDLHADVNPVCAWILPNHLDNSLLCFDNQGNGLGEVRVVVNDKQQRVVVWQPVPYSQYTTIASLQPNFPHLAQFLVGLQGKGVQAFDNLTKLIDDTLWLVDPAGGQYNTSLAVYIGRPLALVRARLQFALGGPPVSDPSWDKTFQPVEPDFLSYSFPIRLGDINLEQSGLLGYFSGDNYDQFNSVYAPSQSGITPTNPPYIVQIGEGNFINLEYGNSPSAYVTMLIEPYGSVYANTGMLPMGALLLPPRFINEALPNMEIMFRTGPLLATLQLAAPSDANAATADVPSIIMPKPSEKHGAWSWLELDGSQWEGLQILASDARANLSTVQATLRSGFLQLSSALGGSPVGAQGGDAPSPTDDGDAPSGDITDAQTDEGETETFVADTVQRVVHGNVMSLLSGGASLLNYSIETTPSPLQASPQQGEPTTAALTVVVSADEGETVYCDRIVFSFEIGEIAQALTNVSSGILSAASPSGEWQIQETGPGIFTATPTKPMYQKIDANGLVFQLYNIKVNRQVGTFAFTIQEHSSSDGSAFSNYKDVYEIAKFPYGFFVGGFTASAAEVQVGTPVLLTWHGARNATYTMLYNNQSVDVTLLRRWQSPPLTSNTTFILKVTPTLEESSEDINTYLQVTVDVRDPDLVTDMFVVKETASIGTQIEGHAVTVNGMQNLSGDLTVGGRVAQSNNIWFQNGATLQEQVSISSLQVGGVVQGVRLAGTMQGQGDASFSTGVQVNGNSTFGTLRVRGTLQVDGSISARRVLVSGAAQLANGKLSVAFSPEQKQSVAGDSSYALMLTPLGQCKGLRVAQKSGDGFVVEELHNGASAVEFDWLAIIDKR